MVVIDTNVLLDVWVFDDPRASSLRQALQSREITWLTTSGMRAEWHRVLHYPHLLARWTSQSLSLDQLMAGFDRASTPVTDAPRSPWVCKDPDDQQFVDLAVAHRAQLISKDKEILRMSKRLAKGGVTVLTQWVPPSRHDA